MHTSSRPLPHGAVTFLFTDIEGSTSIAKRMPDAMRTALAMQDRTAVTMAVGGINCLAAGT